MESVVRRLRRKLARLNKLVSSRGLRHTRDSDSRDGSDEEPPPPSASADRFRRGSRRSLPREGEGGRGDESSARA